jgi:hypothetical protein
LEDWQAITAVSIIDTIWDFAPFSFILNEVPEKIVV